LLDSLLQEKYVTSKFYMMKAKNTFQGKLAPLAVILGFAAAFHVFPYFLRKPDTQTKPTKLSELMSNPASKSEDK